MLLKSCAMPPARRPTASSFSAWRSRVSSRSALGLGLLALGDVAEVEHHRAHARLVQQILARELDPAVRAVLVPHPHVVDRDLARLAHELRAQFERVLALLGMDEIHHLGAAQLIHGEAEQALDRGARVEDAALGRARKDQRVRAVLDHRLVAPPAARQRALAPREAPGGEGDQAEHRRRGEQRAVEHQPGFVAPGREHRLLVAAARHQQREAAHRRGREQHLIVADRARGPALEAPVARRTPSMMRPPGNARPRALPGSGTRVISVPLLESSVMNPPSPRSMAR